MPLLSRGGAASAPFGSASADPNDPRMARRHALLCPAPTTSVVAALALHHAPAPLIAH